MHVLLALSDATLRATLHDALGAAGHEVTIVTDAAAVVDAIALDGESIVLAGDSAAIPGGAASTLALDVCRAVRRDARATTRTFVLAMLPSAVPGDIEELVDAGVDDFILAESTPASLGARVVARATLGARFMAEAAARRSAEAALARTQRLLGIDEASATLQHEINNPLAALLAHASLLEQGIYEPGEERELLGVITEQAYRIAAVVKRLAALRYPDADEFIPS